MDIQGDRSIFQAGKCEFTNRLPFVILFSLVQRTVRLDLSVGSTTEPDALSRSYLSAVKLCPIGICLFE